MRRIDARCERKNFMGAEMLLRKMGSVLFDEARRLRRAARRTRGPTTPMQSVSRCVGDIGVRLTAGKAVSVRPQDAFARHSGQASRLRADQRDHLAVLRPGTLPRSFLPPRRLVGVKHQAGIRENLQPRLGRGVGRRCFGRPEVPVGHRTKAGWSGRRCCQSLSASGRRGVALRLLGPEAWL